MTSLTGLAWWLPPRGPRDGADAVQPVLPRGDGPLILMVGDAGAIGQSLRRRRPGVRLGSLGPASAGVPQVLPAPPAETGAARALLDQVAPAAVVLADGTLPAALVSACDDRDVPVTLIADRHQIAAASARTAWRGLRRGPLARLARVLVPDRAAEDAALGAGIAPQRIEIVGAAPAVLAPLRGNLREYATLRPMLAGRHVWLAAALPASEASAIMAAQRAVLSSHHRALLIVAPARPEDAAPIAEAARTARLDVARRDADEDPGPDVQLLLAEDSAELGLWYRLSPIVFAGGTLVAADPVARHPFEAAGLGAALLHGPHLASHGDLWRALDAAGGARLVRGAVQLGAAVQELGAPDAAARLAVTAWGQATAGADVTRRVVDALLSDLPEAAA